MFARSSINILKGFKKWLGCFKLYHYRIPLEIDGRYKTRKSRRHPVLIDPVPQSNSRQTQSSHPRQEMAFAIWITYLISLCAGIMTKAIFQHFCNMIRNLDHWLNLYSHLNRKLIANGLNSQMELIIIWWISLVKNRLKHKSVVTFQNTQWNHCTASSYLMLQVII